MKVPPPTNMTEQPATNVNKATSKRGAPEATNTAGEEDGVLGAAHGRDFASVLEDITRARNRQDHESNDSERQDTKASDRAEHEREAQRRRDQRDEGTGGGGFDQRSGVREARLRGEATSARAILHIADLERIVAAVRTQIIAGGRREVTLELQRSVLEGLRVKLSADEAGRITAEFIAATEKVRAQLDARSSDLAELLRSRGINLAALRTTVGTDFNQSATNDDQRHAFDAFAPAGQVNAVPSTGPTTDSAATDEISSTDTTSTYRA